MVNFFLNPLYYPILVPFLFGLIILWCPYRWKERLALTGSGFNLLLCILLFLWKPLTLPGSSFGGHSFLVVDNLAGFILLFQALSLIHI